MRWKYPNRKMIMKGSTMEPKGPKWRPKWSERVPNGDQNGTETDPKRSRDVKLALPSKFLIFESFLDAFRGYPRVHFGAKIYQSSMEKPWTNHSKKWCWTNCDLYSKVIRNWCQNGSKSGTKLNQKCQQIETCDFSIFAKSITLKSFFGTITAI